MFLIDKRYLRSFDWLGFLIILVLSGIGLLFVFSATYKPEQPFSLFFKKQLFGMISGFVIYFIFCFFHYQTLERSGYFLYFATVCLLLFTSIKGSVAMGGQRWINLGIIKFQPSELAKLFLSPFFSYYIAAEDALFALSRSLAPFVPIFFVLGFSALLIAKQPDLGTALIILFSGVTLLWLAGLSRTFFIYSFFACALATPLFWHYLKPYQRKRIEVFLGAGNRAKERYQIEQSRIAIGSGGLCGKGFLQGTQNRLMFLPESRTDFIFAVLCEEWGFLGSSILVLLYTLLFVRSLFIIRTIKSFSVQLLATGLVLPLIFSTVINISMVMGLLPIVGIPLPFMSYGISHLWITFASLGWFNGIAMRRFYLGTQTL